MDRSGVVNISLENIAIYKDVEDMAHEENRESGEELLRSICKCKSHIF